MSETPYPLTDRQKQLLKSGRAQLGAIFEGDLLEIPAQRSELGKEVLDLMERIEKLLGY